MVNAGLWLHRRKFVEGLAATAIVLPVLSGRFKQLKAANIWPAVPFGAAARASLLATDRQYREALVAHCSHLTPEIEFKWDRIQPDSNRFSFDEADGLANFSRDNGIEIYGHTLLWHRSVPPWAAEEIRTTKNWSIVEQYFNRMIGRYTGVRYWDVVNEPIDTGFRSDGLRPSLFVEAFGDNYIALALNTARAASATARLVINEYGFEYDLTVERDRRYHFLKLIERLKKQDLPLDGIGLQAHLDLRKGKISQAHIEGFLADIKSFGLFVFVTELDVTEAGYYESVEARDLSVADEVSRYLDVVCNYPDLRGVSTWGITDRYSWLGLANEEVEAFIDKGFWKDGSSPGLNRGLPLDTDMRPKPFASSLASHSIRKL